MAGPVTLKAGSYPAPVGGLQGLRELSATEIKDQVAGVITAKFAADTDGSGTAELNVVTKDSAQLSLKNLDSAIQKVSGQRAELGALQNRLTSVINNLQVSHENLSATNSRIRDTDYANEAANGTRLTILQNMGTSVLSQANSNPQLALKLIG